MRITLQCNFIFISDNARCRIVYNLLIVYDREFLFSLFYNA